MAGFACLGELLMRLSAPASERLLQSKRLNVVFGGAEANVAVMLARLGHHARMGSVVPQNALGQAVISELRGHGVDVSAVANLPGRMGLYFLTPGAMNRPAEVLYDRAGSAFASDADKISFEALLEGADWLHVSGITPAVSPVAAKAAQAAVRAARARRVKVSFDGNYRAQLWQSWDGDGPAILRDILSHADLAFINEKDVALLTGQSVSSREDGIALAFDTFPNLSMIAATQRNLTNATVQTLQGALYHRDGQHQSRIHDLVGVIDRIGSGDAFAAGILHGLQTDLPLQEAVEFATAAAALKHSIPGDFNLVDEEEVRTLMDGDQRDVRR